MGEERDFLWLEIIMNGRSLHRSLFFHAPGQGRGWYDFWSSESRLSELAGMFVPSIVSRSSNFPS